MKNSILIAFLFFTSLISHASDTALDLKMEGDKAYRNRMYVEAIGFYQQSLDIEENPVVRRNLGISAFFSGNYDLAKCSFDEVLMSLSDAKTLFWSGRVRLAQKNLVEAIFYFESAQKADDNDENIKKWLKTARGLWDEALAPLKVPYAQDLSLMLEILKEFAADQYETMLKALPNLSSSPMGNSIENFIARINLQKGHYPVPLIERPHEIASFIGGGSRIITVCVQTLPFWLAQKFEAVQVVDTSNLQLIFHNKLFAAKNGGNKKLQQFMKSTQGSLCRAIADHIGTMPDAEKEVGNLLQDAYGPLFSMAIKNNITTVNGDIFDQNPAPGEWVFISTIPGMDDGLWAATLYPKIRAWVLQGTNVVYTIFLNCFQSQELLQGFTKPFNDIAIVSYKFSEDSFGTIYVKVMPKN